MFLLLSSNSCSSRVARLVSYLLLTRRYGMLLRPIFVLGTNSTYHEQDKGKKRHRVKRRPSNLYYKPRTKRNKPSTRRKPVSKNNEPDIEKGFLKHGILPRPVEENQRGGIKKDTTDDEKGSDDKDEDDDSTNADDDAVRSTRVFHLGSSSYTGYAMYYLSLGRGASRQNSTHTDVVVIKHILSILFSPLCLGVIMTGGGLALSACG